MHEMRRKHLPEPYHRLGNAFRYGENLLPVSFITRKLKFITLLLKTKKQQKYAPPENEYRHFIVTLTKRIVTSLNDPQVGATLRDVIAAKHFFLLS